MFFFSIAFSSAVFSLSVLVTVVAIVAVAALPFTSPTNVVDVIELNDEDKTCIDGIRKAIEKYPNKKIKFANGGDRDLKNTPTNEKEFCEKVGIVNLWEIGGDFKKNSSFS